MKTKICTKCKKEKLSSDFHKDNHTNDGLQYCCIKCRKKYTIIHKNQIKKRTDKWYIEHHVKIRNQRKNKRKSEPWLSIFDHINQRCNNVKNPSYHRYGYRGIKCFITLEELKFLWFRDKAYEMKKPSIHRINNDGNYTFDNCVFIELNAHISLHKSIKILQFDLQGNFIREWKSGIEAAKHLKISNGNISSALKGMYKQLGGYIWKYKVV